MYLRVHRYPAYYEDAKELLQDILSKHKRVQFGVFGGVLDVPAEVTFFSVEDSEDAEGASNLRLSLMSRSPVFGSSYNSFIDQQRRFQFFSPKGDDYWTPRMVNLVWEGKKPSTVAIELETKEVYLVYIYDTNIVFKRFSKLDDAEFEVIQNDIDEAEPYRIELDQKAMFEYIDGAEGVNRLISSIYINFNCAVPLHVSAKPPEAEDPISL